MAQLSVSIDGFDPVELTELGGNERLYTRLTYQSDEPIRFQPAGYLNGVRQEVGLMMKAAVLQVPGEGEAVTWLTFSNVTRIDEIRIEVLDVQWQPIASVKAAIDMKWHGRLVAQPRKPADWVEPILRKERFKQEYVYDPSPLQGSDVNDLFFMISVVSFPLYVLIQVQMLRRYRKRWRELAAIPLISVMPLILASLVGFGMEFRHWIILIFRGVPFVLVYLVLLWLFKRFSNKTPWSVRQ